MNKVLIAWASVSSTWNMTFNLQQVCWAYCSLVRAPNQSVYPWGNTPPLVMLTWYHILAFWQELSLFFMFTYFLASFGHLLFHAKCRIFHFSTIEILVKSHSIYRTIWADWCICNSKSLHVGNGSGFFFPYFLSYGAAPQ